MGNKIIVKLRIGLYLLKARLKIGYVIGYHIIPILHYGNTNTIKHEII